MRRPRRAVIVSTAVLLAMSVAATGVVTASTATAATAPSSDAAARRGDFVTRQGTQLFLNGKLFRFGGSNNYYLEYASQHMVDSVFEAASDAQFRVMRAWAFFDVGVPGQRDTYADPSQLDKNIWFQYLDPATGKPARNEDPATGLPHLDYMVYKAKQEGVKLVLPLTNNWRDFGGMDQYVRWAGGSYHDDFYSDATVKGYFKDWISYLLNRVNTYTGVKYKDEPTIMTWELANEPRCQGSGVYPTSPHCTTAVTTAWADEMSRYIKSIDRNHLTSVGDEGFLADQPGTDDFMRNGGAGIDDKLLAALSAVDVVSFHAYPDYWGKDRAWVNGWVKDHITVARQAGKAVMWGEYGWQNKATRMPVYKEWLDTFFLNGGNGALYWLLADEQDGGSLYPDYDGFTVYCPSPGCILQTNFNRAMAFDLLPPFGPVADDDSAVTEANTPVDLNPLANDIAYLGKVKTNSTDLDPATAGRQTTRAVSGGTYALAGATLTFTPDQGFAGKAKLTYTVKDSVGLTSNEATVTVEVKPDPNATFYVYDFENDAEGFAFASWQTDAGTVAQTTAFHTHGAGGLHVTSVNGGWLGLQNSAALSFAGRTTLKYDVSTGDAGTSTAVALQLGSTFEWCQSSFGWANQGGVTTVTIDLAAGLTPSNDQSFNCAANLGDVKAVWIWISAGGSYDVDAVRVE
jgi:mannan endo-1,4-beta-mannosidase